MGIDLLPSDRALHGFPIPAPTASEDGFGFVYDHATKAFVWTHLRGGELKYAEATTNFNSSSLAAGSWEDVTGLSITFTATDRPVLLEAGGAGWSSATTAGRPELLIALSDNTVYARTRYTSANTGNHHNPYARRRVQLTAGVSYTFKARLGNQSGAGASAIMQLQGTVDAPSYIMATEV